MADADVATATEGLPGWRRRRGGQRPVGVMQEAIYNAVYKAPMRQVDVARTLGITTGTVSFHIASLHRAGRVIPIAQHGGTVWRATSGPAAEGDTLGAHLRPARIADKVKTLEQLARLLQPRLAAELREIAADLQTLTRAPAAH